MDVESLSVKKNSQEDLQSKNNETRELGVKQASTGQKIKGDT